MKQRCRRWRGIFQNLLLIALMIVFITRAIESFGRLKQQENALILRNVLKPQNVWIIKNVIYKLNLRVIWMFMHFKMIGTTTHIRNSRRVLYPSLSICTRTWSDKIFNKDTEDLSYGTVELIKQPDFRTSPPVYTKLQKIQHWIFNNLTG